MFYCLILKPKSVVQVERQRVGGGEEGVPNMSSVERPPCSLLFLPFGKAIVGSSVRHLKPLQ